MRRAKGTDRSFVDFRYVSGFTMVAGLNNVAVSPTAAFSPRLTAIADTWALYRVVSLRFRLRRATTITTSQAAGFIPGVTDSPPGSVTILSEVLPSTYLALTDTVPSSWATVSKRELQGYQTWYKTVVGSPGTDAEVVGYIFLAGTGTETVTLEYEGRFEFSDGVPTGATPAAVKLASTVREEKVRAARERERNRLLALLAPSASLGGT